jgi:hypothetical protein
VIEPVCVCAIALVSRATGGIEARGSACGFRTNPTGPRQDILVQVIDKTITPYVRPANEEDPWRVGPGGMAEDVEDRGGVMTGMIDIVDGMNCLGMISPENSQVLFRDIMGWDYDYEFLVPGDGCE